MFLEYEILIIKCILEHRCDLYDSIAATSLSTTISGFLLLVNKWLKFSYLAYRKIL